jgi:hypothetical protein
MWHNHHIHLDLIESWQRKGNERPVIYVWKHHTIINANICVPYNRYILGLLMSTSWHSHAMDLIHSRTSANTQAPHYTNSTNYVQILKLPQIFLLCIVIVKYQQKWKIKQLDWRFQTLNSNKTIYKYEIMVVQSIIGDRLKLIFIMGEG